MRLFGNLQSKPHTKHVGRDVDAAGGGGEGHLGRAAVEAEGNEVLEPRLRGGRRLGRGRARGAEEALHRGVEAASRLERGRGVGAAEPPRNCSSSKPNKMQPRMFSFHSIGMCASLLFRIRSGQTCTFCGDATLFLYITPPSFPLVEPTAI